MEGSLPLEGWSRVDESYFAESAKANAGAAQPAKSRSSALRRGGKLHTMMISDVRKDTLLPIIRHKVVPDSIVYTDSYPAYDVLDVSEFHHHRIDHSDAYVLDRHNHINGIENFWNQAKRTFSRYNGIPKAHLPLFSKRPNFASTTENPASNCELSNAGPNSSLSQPIWDSPNFLFCFFAFRGSAGRPPFA